MKSLKFLLLAAFLCLPVMPHSHGAEVRTVGNTEVDLQPLIDWSAKKKGDRPLKHWKLLQVLELKKQAAAPVLICDIEVLKTEIILRNCPRELLDLLRQKAELEAKLTSARKEEGAAAENLNEAHNKRQARQAKRANTAARDTQKVLNKELTGVDQKIKQQKLYAMATGATFDGLPVWDTGLRSR
jgi:hypothetical protein